MSIISRYVDFVSTIHMFSFTLNEININNTLVTADFIDITFFIDVVF